MERRNASFTWKEAQRFPKALGCWLGFSLGIALLMGLAFEKPADLGLLFLLGVLASVCACVSIGRVVRSKAPGFAKKTEKAAGVLSLLFLFLIIAAVVKKNWAEMPLWFAQTGWAAFTLNAGSIILGFGIALAMRVCRRDAITIGIEVGIQNGTTALFITGVLLQSPEASIAPAIYSLIMFGTGAVFGVLVNVLWREKAVPDVEPSVVEEPVALAAVSDPA